VTQIQFRQLAEDFYVAPQLAAADFAAARALGIRTVINNRPDREAADQLSDDEAKAAAAAAGLAYAFVPVVSGGISPEAVAAFRQAVARHAGPYLAYCRSGTRSCHVWALATAGRRPVDEIVGSAAAAGYDLAPARPLLEHLARSR
jgi:sulfide:quinone oxidoreductase